MLPPQTAYHLRKALLWTCIIGGCAALGCGFAGGWKASLGVLGGTVSMAGALWVSAVRTAAILSSAGTGKRAGRAVLARVLWLVGSAIVFWALLGEVRVPGWSMAVGVTACVAGSVVGFLAKEPGTKARQG
jgi:hypothetical protein